MVGSRSRCRRRRPVRVPRSVGSPSSPKCYSSSPSAEVHVAHGRASSGKNEGPPKKSLLEKIVEFDKKFSAWVHEQGLVDFFYVFLRTLEFSGDGVFLIPCAAATYLAPTPKLTPELRMFFFDLFMVFLFDLIFVSIIKKIVRRPRPSYNRGHFMTLQVDHWSFPSGHSTRALMVVTFFRLYLPMWKEQWAQIWMPYLTELWKDKVLKLEDFVPTVENHLISFIAGVVTSWAVATTSSRIILGRHFFCDVVAGSLLGISESVFVHHILFIPGDTAEFIHQYINGAFGWIQYSTWKIFHGRFFLLNQLKFR